MHSDWMEGEKLNMLKQHFSKFNFQFCQPVATDALGGDHTSTEYESLLCADKTTGNWKWNSWNLK